MLLSIPLKHLCLWVIRSFCCTMEYTMPMVRIPNKGIEFYTSDDLLTWKYGGLALNKEDSSGGPLVLGS